MNTSKIKQYAPKARNNFIAAITKKANQLGIYQDKISEVTEAGGALQIEGKSFDIAYKSRRARLIKSIEQNSFESVIEKVAYSWFNRLCAIRYMELHDYLVHGFRVLSHPDQNTSLEILDHAKEASGELGLKTDEIIDLQLAGNKEEELYRKLLLAQCHQLHKAMPFLFESIDDETELLLPEGLTRTDSLIRELVTSIPEEDWEQVEIIGWLYQFYISEKKDEVIGKVVKSEDIPAATQLFTPNWIVKYLVQNSVGRQWLQTYPDSSIKKEMEYYIEPAEQTEEVNQQLKAITPESIDPEEIKVLDPACGSGHILVEAYSLLREIYIERGYKKKNFPKLILENNIFGLDIDDRAAQLSGFALMMKAREDDRRIFTRDIELNVMSLQSTQGMNVNPDDWLVISDEQERKGLLLIIKDLLELFKQAKTFGSLIEVPDKVAEYLPTLERKIQQVLESGDMFAISTAESLIPIVNQAKILTQKYDSVIANPPYLNTFPLDLKKYLESSYPKSKYDLYLAFINKALTLSKNDISFITMHNWMFLPSCKMFRYDILSNHSPLSLLHLGARAFESIGGEVVQTVAFVLRKKKINGLLAKATKLEYLKSSKEKSENIKSEDLTYRYTHEQFQDVPGMRLIYWFDEYVINIYKLGKFIKEFVISDGQTKTGNNDLYLRHLWEIEKNKIHKKWVLHPKGGAQRSWFGNVDTVINWSEEARLHYRKDRVARILPEYLWARKGFCWSNISSSDFISFREVTEEEIFNLKAPTLFYRNENDRFWLLPLLNSSVVSYLMSALNKSLSYNINDVESIPVCSLSLEEKEYLKNQYVSATKIQRDDWISYEENYGFNTFNLHNSSKLTSKYVEMYWLNIKKDMEHLGNIESKLDDFFIKKYHLEKYIPKREKYLVKKNISDGRSDLIIRLLSYCIGCMMGRFSLVRKGLIYAHSCNTAFSDLVDDGAYKNFPADDDGIIPLTDLEWFDDDATYRFKEFLITVWGQETLQENTQFVAESLTLHAIKPKKGESSLETIRRYFSTGFFKQHLKTYKKRPIYWLFTSGKHKAFEALVYLHRYNESTLARMRTEYVTPLMGKYEARADSLQQQLDTTSGTEARRIEKELKVLNNKQTELRTFDDKLKHYADMRINIDLDDGVKVNYGKFGDLLAEVKAVTGKKPVVRN